MRLARSILATACAAALVQPLMVRGDDTDALSLQSAPVADNSGQGAPLRLFAEAAVGKVQQRYGLRAFTARRFSQIGRAHV